MKYNIHKSKIIWLKNNFFFTSFLFSFIFIHNCIVKLQTWNVILMTWLDLNIWLCPTAVTFVSLFMEANRIQVLIHFLFSNRVTDSTVWCNSTCSRSKETDGKVLWRHGFSMRFLMDLFRLHRTRSSANKSNVTSPFPHRPDLNLFRRRRIATILQLILVV